MDWKLKYDITSNGFLPEKCEDTLPEKFKELLNVINNLDSTNFINLVDDLDLYNVPNIYDLEDKYLKYLYSSLTIIMNKYLYFDLNNIKSLIPFYIGQLLVNVSEKLGLKPVISYYTNAWNWKLIDPTKPISIENLTMINTIINKDDDNIEDEKWFNIITLYIESISANVIDPIELIYQEITKSSPDQELIIKNLRIICSNIILISDAIKRLREKCRYDVYFNRIRVYISGSNNTQFFKDGVKIKNLDIKLSFHGVSGAQSAMIQTFDRFFSIEHPTTSNYLTSMREHMPDKFRKYIEFIDKRKSLREYINDNKLDNNSDIVKLFNECIRYLVIFRSRHLAIIKNYTSKYLTEKDLSYAVNYCSDMIKDYCHDKI